MAGVEEAREEIVSRASSKTGSSSSSLSLSETERSEGERLKGVAELELVPADDAEDALRPDAVMMLLRGRVASSAASVVGRSH